MKQIKRIICDMQTAMQLVSLCLHSCIDDDERVAARIANNEWELYATNGNGFFIISEAANVMRIEGIQGFDILNSDYSKLIEELARQKNCDLMTCQTYRRLVKEKLIRLGWVVLSQRDGLFQLYKVTPNVNIIVKQNVHDFDNANHRRE